MECDYLTEEDVGKMLSRPYSKTASAQDCEQELKIVPKFDQSCPVCGKHQTVGRLCGGHNPLYYCRNCDVEFKILNSASKGIIARVSITTMSGMKVGDEYYKYYKRSKKFKKI